MITIQNVLPVPSREIARVSINPPTSVTRFGKNSPKQYLSTFIYLVFGKFLNLHWNILLGIEQLFIFVNGQILSKCSSHLVTLSTTTLNNSANSNLTKGTKHWRAGLSISISVTRKNRQISIKVAKNDFTRKMIDFNSFTKIS